MIRYLFSFCLKLLFSGIFWLCIFSSSWNGRTFFDHGHEIFLENKVAVLIQEELDWGWQSLKSFSKKQIAEFKNVKSEESG